MNIYIKVLGSSFLIVTIGNAVAGGMTEDKDITFHRFQEGSYWEIIGMGGYAGLDTDNINLRVTDIETDTLVVDDSWDAWSVQLGVGFVAPIFGAAETKDFQWLPSIEPQFNVYYLSGKIEGDVYRYESPEFNQLDFKTNVESTRFMFDLGLTIASWNDFSLYGLAGIGPAINRVDLSTTNDCDLPNINLDGKNDMGFAYEFGGGLTYDLGNRVGISVQYLYAGLGNAEFEDDDIQADDFDLTSQTVFLGLRYEL